MVINLSPADFTPGTYVQSDFAVGPSAGSSASQSVLIIGNKTSAGSATADTVVYGPNSAIPMLSEADCINLFGAGSEVHIAYRLIASINQNVNVFAIAPVESAGSAASLAVTLTTTAAANGNLRVFVGGSYTDVAILTGDTPTVIAANAASALNGRPALPVSATASAGVLTITAKNKGPRGNRIRAAAVVQGAGVAVTSSASAFAWLAGGTTNDSWTNVLATINPLSFSYIVSADDGYADDGGSAGNLQSLVSQVNTQSLAINNNRQRVVAGSNDTLGNVLLDAVSINAPRCDIGWQQNSDFLPVQIAAQLAAVYLLEEASGASANLTCNFDFYGSTPKTQGNWKLHAPYDGTIPLRASVKSALAGGVSAISGNSAGLSWLVSAKTTYCQNVATSAPDYRCADHHKVTVCDLFAADIQALVASSFSGKLIGNDPAQGQKAPAGAVVTPNIFQALVNKEIQNYGDDGLLQNVNDIINATTVVRATSPTTRLNAVVQLQVADCAHQFTVSIEQVA